MFYLAQPHLTPAQIKPNQGEPRYPVFNEQNRITGTVILEFIVDTNGRVERGSVHDLWNSGKPRLTGELGRYYGEFVRAVSDWVQHSQFTPARWGPCPVRQIAHFPVRCVTPESKRAEDATRESQ